MHTNKVLHRDLKTQNVFMLGNGRLVLGDLGISKVISKELSLIAFYILHFTKPNQTMSTSPCSAPFYH